MNDQDIEVSEISEVTPEQMAHAALWVRSNPAARGRVRVRPDLNAEVVAQFKT